MRRMMAVGVVLVVSLAACSDDGDGAYLLVLGDSITVISSDEIKDKLSDYSTVIKADSGRKLADQFGAASALAQPPPEIIIVNLGINDVAKENADLVDDMKQILQKFRRSCRVVVTVSSHLFQAEQRQLANELNDYIRRGNWVVADWDELITEYKEDGEPDGSLTTDTIHPTELGKDRLAELLDEAVADC